MAHVEKTRRCRYLENVQGALCQDCAKCGGQAEFYQTFQMSHFFCLCLLSSLFQSAAVY